MYTTAPLMYAKIRDMQFDGNYSIEHVMVIKSICSQSTFESIRPNISR